MKTQSSLLNRATRGLALALGACALVIAPAAQAQKAYPTPDAAANAFVQSLAANDGDALKAIVGADYAKYIPHRTANRRDQLPRGMGEVPQDRAGGRR